MLSEIHISLLKFIIKDIEDVVSSISPGGNHNSAANPGIGHSQVVVKEVCNAVYFTILTVVIMLSNFSLGSLSVIFHF